MPSRCETSTWLTEVRLASSRFRSLELPAMNWPHRGQLVRRRRQQLVQVRVALLELAGEQVQVVRPVLDRRAGVELGLQHGLAVVDQLERLAAGTAGPRPSSWSPESSSCLQRPGRGR